MLIKKLSKSLAMLAILSAVSVHNASAAGDATNGKRVFEDECGECHAIGKNKKGPNLVGVVGRKAGSLPGFEYSAVIKASNVIWSAEGLDSYLTMPKRFIPGAPMKYDGLFDAKARADLIAFILSLK